MWSSKKRFEEMQEKLDQIDERLDIVISKTIEEPSYNKIEHSTGSRNTFLVGYPVKCEKVSTRLMENITLEDLALFCIDGKPLTKSVNPNVKVRTGSTDSSCPEYGYYNRGGAL